MSFEPLFRPFDHLDEALTELFAGAPLLVALAILQKSLLEELHTVLSAKPSSSSH
jgi:hypothetical protein